MNLNDSFALHTGDYHYSSSELAHTHAYLWPTLTKVLGSVPAPARIFELGCGNGSTSNEMAKLGYEVLGVDPSGEGIALARAAFPQSRFEIGSAYDDLAARYGTFDVVVSLEVVEHLFQPRKYAATIKSLLKPGGYGIISTPYHGYFKNLVLAILGKWDSHLAPLWDFGHIKFWSRPTLIHLFAEAGLREVAFYRVGRIPPIANSMVLVVKN